MSTLDFNVDYGDIEISPTKDLSTLQTTDQDVIQCIHSLLKTEQGDYRLRPNYGIDFQKWIGAPINVPLADAIKREIEERLFELPQVKEKKPEVLYIIQKSTIVFRIIVKGSDSVNFTFVKDKGVKVLR